MSKTILIIALASFLMTSCDFKKEVYGTTEKEQTTSSEENSYEVQREGYKKGYDDGYDDGYGWMQHGVSYNDRNNYQNDDVSRAYKNAYSNGYDEGYDEGEGIQKSKRERARLSDWHNWEHEDVDALYVYMDGVENDDMADYVARERYNGRYISVGWMYFAQIEYNWGEYNINLGEKISSNLFKIKGRGIYIHFKWGLPDVHKGDEGVLDWKGHLSSFYKKPDNL